jgi:hypothetical protein
MPAVHRNKSYSAKTVSTVEGIKDIRDWLRINCKSRWHATNYKGEDFNWRKLAKADFKSLGLHGMDLTVIVHFKKPEDLMLYLLSWPSEVLISD